MKMLNQGSAAAETQQVTASPGPSCISAVVFVVGAHQLFPPHRVCVQSCRCYSGATWKVKVQREKHWWGRDAGPPACLVPHTEGKGSSSPMGPLHLVQRWKFSLQEQGLEFYLPYRNTGISKPCMCLVQFIRADTSFFSCCIKSPVRFWFLFSSTEVSFGSNLSKIF